MLVVFFLNSFFSRLEWILDGFSTVALVLVLLGRAVDGLHWLEGWCPSPKHSITHRRKDSRCSLFSFFNWTSSWTPEEKTWECCSGKVHRMSSLCSQIQKSGPKPVKVLRNFPLRHICWNVLGQICLQLQRRWRRLIFGLQRRWCDGWNKWRETETERGTLRVAMATTADGIH